VAKLSIFCHHRCIRKIINSLPLRRKLLRNFLLRVRSNKKQRIREKTLLLTSFTFTTCPSVDGQHRIATAFIKIDDIPLIG
jgi:hypothetical protein